MWANCAREMLFWAGSAVWDVHHPFWWLCGLDGCAISSLLPFKGLQAMQSEHRNINTHNQTEMCHDTLHVVHYYFNWSATIHSSTSAGWGKQTFKKRETSEQNFALTSWGGVRQWKTAWVWVRVYKITGWAWVYIQMESNCYNNRVSHHSCHPDSERAAKQKMSWSVFQTSVLVSPSCRASPLQPGAIQYEPSYGKHSGVLKRVN